MADEDLLPSVRQLISKIEPTIRSASSVDEAEEMLLHLEETDENFHRYEFIKYLRNKIDTALSSLIDEEIEKKMVGGRGKGKEAEKIQSVTEAVVESPVYAELTQTLKQTTKDAIDRLLETFEEDVAKERKILEGRVSPKKTGFPFSDDSSFDSSFNQANFSFPNAEKFQMLANNLESCQPLEVRRDALKQLCQFPPADVLACDQWGKLKKGLGAALSDSDEQLEDRSLKFHAKMFSTNSHTITKEVYTSLVDHLATLFQSRKSKASITTSEGLNTSEQNVQRVLRKFRLMNEFQRQAPSYWIRFPEKFVDDVLESTLSLLAIHTASETMTPLHYLSLLDPQAMWFKMWMHSNYSRTAVIRIIKKHRNLIDTCVKFLMDFVSSRKMPQDIVSDVTEKLKKGKIGEDRRILFTAREVEYVYFVHCLGIVGVVLLYHNGRDLFPVKHRDKEVAVTDLLVALIQLLSDGGSQHMLKRAAVFDPGNLVRDVLKNLSASHAVCSACICKNKVITELISPIKSWLPGKKNKAPSKLPKESTLLHIAEILSVLASLQCGRQILLYGESKERLQTNKSAPMHSIVEFAKKSLSHSLSTSLGPPPSRAVVGAYVFVCRQLYSNCEGLHVLYHYGLHTYIADAWKEAKEECERAPTPTPDTEGDTTSQSGNKQECVDAFAWEQMLVDNLLNFAGTPKIGLFYVIPSY
ncbi:protein broad-minded-like [Saccoglossus kowalevskii]